LTEYHKNLDFIEMILQTRELNHRLLAHTLQDRSKYNSVFYEFINKNTS